MFTHLHHNECWIFAEELVSRHGLLDVFGTRNIKVHKIASNIHHRDDQITR